MRRITLLTLCLSVAFPAANAQIAPQTVRPPETMADPGANWVIVKTREAGYIYDASTGDMQGLVSMAGQTPTIQPHEGRREFYTPGTFHSRGVFGEREAVLVIHDFENLSPIAEIELPDKLTILDYQRYIGLMSDGNHIAISNLTPAQSVTIVDVVNREVVGEISTPGCSLILPVENNDFLTICGDGTLMLVQLDADGNEAARQRSPRFFDVQDDAVSDQPAPTADGWLLVTDAGNAYEVSVSGSTISIDNPWAMVSDEDREENWWPGGRQKLSVHRDLGLAYQAMHQGEQYTHHDPGTEIWVFGLGGKRRIGRIEFEVPVESLMVTQEDEPLLMITDEEGGLHVYDALTFRFLHTIEGPSGVFVDL